MLALEGVGHEERDELLRILVRPVGVRSPGDHGRHPVGVVIGQHLQVPARFRGRVGAGGSQRVVLGAGAFVDRTVHLVGGHLHHAGDAQLADGFQERVDAEDVRAKERLRVHDGAVHVGLGGEVDDGVHAFGRPRDRLPVADVGADEAVARVRLHLAQVVRVAGVGELVQVDDVHRLPALPAEQPADEVGADETGASAHKDPQVLSLLRAWSSRGLLAQQIDGGAARAGEVRVISTGQHTDDARQPQHAGPLEQSQARLEPPQPTPHARGRAGHVQGQGAAVRLPRRRQPLQSAPA